MFYNKGLCDHKYLEADGNMSTSKSGKFTTYIEVSIKITTLNSKLVLKICIDVDGSKLSESNRGSPFRIYVYLPMRPNLQNTCHCELLSLLIF